jgi:PP-loop superfamily ATP-utilizing enzyme
LPRRIKDPDEVKKDKSTVVQQGLNSFLLTVDKIKRHVRKKKNDCCFFSKEKKLHFILKNSGIYDAESLISHGP